MHTKATGSFGENYAFALLESLGYKLLRKNFRSKFGEIDAVCIKNDVLVFVEVKTRHSFKYGLPEEAVTPFKLKKIARVGDYFLKINPRMPKKVRIDVVSLIITNGEVSSAKIIEVV